MPPLSMSLQAALGGRGEMTPELMCEWQSKRPQAYRDYVRQYFSALMSDVAAPELGAIMSTYNEAVA